MFEIRYRPRSNSRRGAPCGRPLRSKPRRREQATPGRSRPPATGGATSLSPSFERWVNSKLGGWTSWFFSSTGGRSFRSFSRCGGSSPWQKSSRHSTVPASRRTEAYRDDSQVPPASASLLFGRESASRSARTPHRPAHTPPGIRGPSLRFPFLHGAAREK